MRQRGTSAWQSATSSGDSADSRQDGAEASSPQRHQGQNNEQQQQQQQSAEQSNGGLNASGRPRRSGAGQPPARLADMLADEAARPAGNSAAAAAKQASDSAAAKAAAGVRAGKVAAASASPPLQPAKKSVPLPELPPDFQPARATRSGRAGAPPPPSRCRAQPSADGGGWSPLGPAVPQAQRHGRQRRPRRDLRRLVVVARGEAGGGGGVGQASGNGKAARQRGPAESPESAKPQGRPPKRPAAVSPEQPHQNGSAHASRRARRSAGGAAPDARHEPVSGSADQLLPDLMLLNHARQLKAHARA